MFLYTDHEVHKGKCVLWQGSHTCKIKLTWLSPTNRLALFTSCSLHFKHFYLYFLPESHQWWFVKDINWSLSSCEMITLIYISLNAYKQVNVSYLAQIGFTGSRFFFSSMFFHCLFITCQKWNMHLRVWVNLLTELRCVSCLLSGMIMLSGLQKSWWNLLNWRWSSVCSEFS